MKLTRTTSKIEWDRGLEVLHVHQLLAQTYLPQTNPAVCKIQLACTSGKAFLEIRLGSLTAAIHGLKEDHH